MGRLIRVAVLACIISGHTQAQITSSFTGNAEGWTTPNDADGTITFSAAGGNPGGFVSGSPFVFVGGAGTFYFPFEFVAPGTYLGNRSPYYSGTLRYDVQQSTTGAPNQYAEVIIANSLGITLYYFPTISNQPPAPPTWATYSVVLNNASGFWKTTNSATGTAATEAQVLNVLTDLASLRIRGLYRDANTTNRLDNVSMRPPIIISVQPTPVTVCNGITTSLTTVATNNPAITYEWQREVSPSVWNAVSNTGGYSGATTASLIVNTTGNFGAGNYRCRISGTGVVDEFTTAATITINASPTAPATTGNASCIAASLVLTATGGSAGQYRWYTVSTGGTAIAGQTNNTYTTPILSVTTTYYVSINNGTCESARTPVIATINTTPAAPGVTGSSACGSGAIVLNATGGTAGQYRWYTAATGGTAIAGQTNSAYTTPVLTTTTTFYVSLNNGFCESSRTAVIATINPIPAPPTTTGASSCTAASISLTASGSTNGNYVWYTVPTGGSPIPGEVNSIYNTPVLSTSTNYYVAIRAGACESSRTVVAATIDAMVCINQPPVIETSTESTVIEGIVTLNLTSLITDPDNNLDATSLKIISLPPSGASAQIINGVLTVNYSGLGFTGTDIVRIEVCDLLGSCTQQNITIEVEGDLIVYTGISPNGDSHNDVWIIKNIELLPDTKKNTVTILNRWGSPVFELTNYDNKERVFRGLNKNGNELPSGVYFYRIEFDPGVARKSINGYLILKQ